MPTYLLTITSATLTRDELMRVFRAFKSRRRRDGRGTWIYVGTCVMSATGAGGYHLHLLLWGSVHINSLNDDLAELGAGRASIKPIKPSPGIDPFANTLEVTAYVLGQEEPVFGTDNYQDNLARPKNKRALMRPQDSTLQKRKPELLIALDRAKDPAVPDDAVHRSPH